MLLRGSWFTTAMVNCRQAGRREGGAEAEQGRQAGRVGRRLGGRSRQVAAGTCTQLRHRPCQAGGSTGAARTQHGRSTHLGKVAPPRQQLVIVSHTEEEGEVVGDVAAVRVHQQVPAGRQAGRRAERGPSSARASAGAGGQQMPSTQHGRFAAIASPPRMTPSQRRQPACRSRWQHCCSLRTAALPAHSTAACAQHRCLHTSRRDEAYTSSALPTHITHCNEETTHHLKVPTSKTFERSSRLPPASPNLSTFHVNLPYSSLVWGPAPTWGLGAWGGAHAGCDAGASSRGCSGSA